jgi:hypothetical protein
LVQEGKISFLRVLDYNQTQIEQQDEIQMQIPEG